MTTSKDGNHIYLCSFESIQHLLFQNAYKHIGDVYMLCMLKFGTIQDRIGIWAAIEPFEIRLGFGAQLNHFGIWTVIEPFGIRLGFGRRLNHLEINIIFVRFHSRVGVAQSLVFFVVFCRSLFVFSGVPVAPSLVFFVVFCRSLFVLLSFVFCLLYFWSLYCPSFDLWLLFTYLLSSNFSYRIFEQSACMYIACTFQMDKMCPL